MNHQFFETLLLNDAELTNVESEMLKEHLETCGVCRQLSDALCEMDKLFDDEPMIAPREGFSLRWQEALEKDTVLRRRRQTLLIVVIGVFSVSVLSLLLGFSILPLFISPMSILWAEVFSLVTWFSAVEAVVNIFATLFRAAFTVVPPTFWIASMVAFLGLCAIWIIAIKQVTAPRRVMI